VTKVVPGGCEFLVLSFHWKDLKASADSCILLTTPPQKLFKIYLVISHINSQFQTLCLAQQEISVNELLTLWKSCLSFQTIPSTEIVTVQNKDSSCV